MLCDLLNTARNEQNLTLQNVSELSGINVSALYKFEHGFALPTEDVIQRLGTVLNIPDEILREECSCSVLCTPYAELGNKLQKRRCELNLRQDDVACRLGCSGSLYGKIEKGQMLPSVKLFRKVAKFTGMDIDDLIELHINSLPKSKQCESALGEVLRRARLRNCLYLYEMADYMFIDKCTYSRMEVQKLRRSSYNDAQLSMMLGLRTEDIDILYNMSPRNTVLATYVDVATKSIGAYMSIKCC